MSDERRRTHASRPAVLGLGMLLTVILIVGCSQDDSDTVQDTEGHGPAVTKNMENFMKGNPYKDQAKKQENVQVK